VFAITPKHLKLLTTGIAVSHKNHTGALSAAIQDLQGEKWNREG
jgi:hypothetical protein